MKALIVILAGMLAVSAQAQTAKVIALSPEDAAQVKSLYQQKVAIEKQIADLQAKIEKSYLAVPQQIVNGGFLVYNFRCGRNVKDGWCGGFEFSEDYKFIVPLPYAPPNNPFGSCGAFVSGGIPLTAN